MKYQVLNEDDKSFHVKHADGSEFRVAKKGLSKDLLSQIQGMKVEHFDEGGIATSQPTMFGFGAEGPGMIDSVDNSIQSSPLLNSLSAQPQPALQPQAHEQLPNIVGADGTLQIPTKAVPQPVQAPQQQTSSPFDMYDPRKSIGAVQGDIKQLGQKEADAMKAQAALYDDQQKAMASHQLEFDKQMADQKQTMDQIHGGIMNDKISPDKFWDNHNRVTAAIGLFLGGLGGGMSGHGGNVAMDFLNKQIDRDMDAQKTELGKKQNLLTWNLQKYHDMQTAEMATRAQMAQGFSSQLQKQALQSGSEQAVLRSKLLSDQIGMQIGPQMGQIAKMKADAQSLGLGTGQGGLPVGQEPYQLLGDPKYQEKRVQLGKMAYQAHSKDDAAQMMNVESQTAPIMDAVRELNGLGSSALIGGSADNLRAKQLMGLLATKLPALAGAQIGAKRINGEEIKYQSERLADPRNVKSFVNGNATNESLLGDLENEVEATRKQHLIGYRPMSSIAGRTSGWKK